MFVNEKPNIQYSLERLDFNEQLRVVAKQKEAHSWNDESPENRAKGMELIRKHRGLETVVNNIAPRYEVDDGISDINPFTVVVVGKNGKRIKVPRLQLLNDVVETPLGDEYG